MRRPSDIFAHASQYLANKFLGQIQIAYAPGSKNKGDGGVQEPGEGDGERASERERELLCLVAATCRVVPLRVLSCCAHHNIRGDDSPLKDQQ